MDKLEQLKNEIQYILEKSKEFVKDFNMVRKERQIGYEQGLQMALDIIDELENGRENSKMY